MLVDVATMLANGGEAIADIDTLRHQGEVLGAVASPPTVWRALDELTQARFRKLDRGAGLHPGDGVWPGRWGADGAGRRPHSSPGSCLVRCRRRRSPTRDREVVGECAACEVAVERVLA